MPILLMMPLVAATVIWQGVLNAQSGWLNRFLEAPGLPGPSWLSDAGLVVPSLALIGTWAVDTAIMGRRCVA